MPITLTCPSCQQPCAVSDEYAGMQVRCPRCPGVISVPAAGGGGPPPIPVSASAAPSVPPLPPVRPQAPLGPSFIDKVTKFLAANGVGGINKILLFVGLGCMAFFLITVLFPWYPDLGALFNPLGILHGPGILAFLLVLGALFLIAFVILMEWSQVFDYALWTVSNLAFFLALQLLVMLQGAGWGLPISFVVMLGAAGTLGVVVFSKLFSRPSEKSRS